MNLPAWVKKLKGDDRQHALLAYANYIDAVDAAKAGQTRAFEKAHVGYNLALDKAKADLKFARKKASLALEKVKTASGTAR